MLLKYYLRYCRRSDYDYEQTTPQTFYDPDLTYRSKTKTRLEFAYKETPIVLDSVDMLWLFNSV